MKSDFLQPFVANTGWTDGWTDGMQCVMRLSGEQRHNIVRPSDVATTDKKVRCRGARFPSLAASLRLSKLGSTNDWPVLWDTYRCTRGIAVFQHQAVSSTDQEWGDERAPNYCRSEVLRGKSWLAAGASSHAVDEWASDDDCCEHWLLLLQPDCMAVSISTFIFSQPQYDFCRPPAALCISSLICIHATCSIHLLMSPFTLESYDNNHLIINYLHVEYQLFCLPYTAALYIFTAWKRKLNMRYANVKLR